MHKNISAGWKSNVNNVRIKKKKKKKQYALPQGSCLGSEERMGGCTESDGGEIGWMDVAVCVCVCSCVYKAAFALNPAMQEKKAVSQLISMGAAHLPRGSRDHRGFS